MVAELATGAAASSFPSAVVAFGSSVCALRSLWQRVPKENLDNMDSYRSALAHGSEPHFQGEHQLLASHETAPHLLRQTVKSVIRQALAEPRLLADLQNC